MSAHELNVLFASIGGLVLILGLFSGAVKGYISLPLTAMLTGFVLGPEVLGILRFMEGVDQQFFLEQVARVSIAMGLIAIALRFSSNRSITQPLHFPH